MLARLALFLADALLRAMALAFAACALSQVGGGARLAFIGSWTAIFLLLTLPVTLLEAPVRSFLDERIRGRISRARRAMLALLLGAVEAVALGRLLLVVRALEPFSAVALGLAAVPAALLPPSRRVGGGGGGRGRNALAGLVVGALAGLVLVNPEARYQEKYARNHLGPQDLAKAPPLPGRTPDSLGDLEVARALAETAIRTHPPHLLPWGWEEAVLVEGLIAYGRRASSAATLDYCRLWVDAHAKEALETTLYADSAAPALAVLALGEAGRANPAVDDPIIARIDRYVREEAPRTRAGAISHAGRLLGGLAPREAWVDTLFMHGVYLDRRARRGDAPWALEEAAKLAKAMAASLREPRTGLFRHAAVDVGPLVVRLPAEECFWARGNAWALAFLVDHAIAARGAKPATAGGPPPEADPELLAALGALRASILKAQRTELGLWRTELVLEGEEGARAGRLANPEETCASALLGWALRRASSAGLAGTGDADRLAARTATIGVRTRIRWQDGHPSLEATSIGTHPGFRAYYRKVPSEENVGHGVGAALLLLCEE